MNDYGTLDYCITGIFVVLLIGWVWLWIEMERAPEEKDDNNQST